MPRKSFVSNNSGNNEWYTPPEFLDAARTVLGKIELDPATSDVANKNVGATEYFTEAHDALSLDWPPSKIWMNPPYASNLIGGFCNKFSEMMEAGGSEGIVLVNNASETGWWQRLSGVSSAICFPKTRVKFLRPEGEAGAPLQGQTIFYSGEDPQTFRREFSQFGFVVFCA